MLSLVDHHCREFVYTGDCGHSDQGVSNYPVDLVFIPVSSLNFTPETGRTLSTQRRAHGMTNVAPTANVAAQQIISKGDKIYPRS